MKPIRQLSVIVASAALLGTVLAGSALAKPTHHHVHHSTVGHTVRAKMHRTGHRTRLAMHHAAVRMHRTGHHMRKAILHHG